MASRRRPLAAATCSGLLLGAASLPGPQGPLGFVALVPLLAVLSTGTAPGRGAALGAVAGALCFGIGFGWILGVDGGGPSTGLAYLLGLALLAAVIGIFGAAVAWVGGRSRPLALLAAPALWTLIEFTRTWDGGLPVPWNHLGYGLAEWPLLIQAAPCLGVYGLGFWIVSVNAGTLLARELGPRARTVLAGLLALPLAPAPGLFGAPQPGPMLRVGAVQPAKAEPLRRDPDRFHENLGELLELSDVAVAGAPDLLIWPESAWQPTLGEGGDAFLSAIAHDLGVPLLTGAWRAAGAGGLRNVAVVVEADGQRAAAEKVHPVPVYERAPGGPLGRWLDRAGLWAGRFARGAALPPVDLATVSGDVPVGVLVCIDAAYPDLARALRESGARVIVSIANEAGTGSWPALVHARIVRLRAAENRVPVLRVANTGPTLWIDARGRVVHALPEGARASGVSDVVLGVPRRRGHGFGDAPVIAGASLSLLVVARRRMRRDSWRATHEEETGT